MAGAKGFFCASEVLEGEVGFRDITPSCWWLFGRIRSVAIAIAKATFDSLRDLLSVRGTPTDQVVRQIASEVSDQNLRLHVAFAGVLGWLWVDQLDPEVLRRIALHGGYASTDLIPLTSGLTQYSHIASYFR